MRCVTRDMFPAARVSGRGAGRLGRRRGGVFDQLEPRTLLSLDATGALAATAPVYTASAIDPLPIDLKLGDPGVFKILDDVDDGSAVIPLGSNTFHFYDTVFTRNDLIVSSNGLISAYGGQTSPKNSDLTTPTDAILAPLWDDWRTDLNSADMVLGKFDGYGGYDGKPSRLVIEWSQVEHYPDSPHPVTFQAILKLNTAFWEQGTIVFNYPSLATGDPSSAEGASATVGVKDFGTGDPNRLLVSYDSTASGLVGSGQAVRVGIGALTVGSLAAAPRTIAVGNSITLTADGLGTATQTIRFYRETNGLAGLQTGAGGDLLISSVGEPRVTCSIQTSTAGLAAGTYTYYAAGNDSFLGVTPTGTAAASTTVVVANAPAIESAKADGSTTLSLTYTVPSGEAAPPFDVQFFRSNHATPQPSDSLLGTVSLSEPADLTPGRHTKVVPIGGGLGQVPLPGLGSPDVPGSYRILVAVNTLGTSPSAIDLIGAYHAPGAELYVLGAPTPDIFTIDPTQVRVDMNGTRYDYDPSDVSGINVRTGPSYDEVTVAGGGVIPVEIYGDSGNDLLRSGPSNVTFDGGGRATVVLTGVTGAADTAQLYPTEATLAGAGYRIFARRVTQSIVNGDGADTVYLHDSALVDGLIFSPLTATVSLSGDGYAETATGFATMYATATQTGDTATMWGDSFNGRAGDSYVAGPGYVCEVLGFHSVQAFLLDRVPDATAVINGGAGDDLLIALPNRADFTESVGGVTLWSYLVTHYHALYAYAGAGGVDTANLYGYTGNDTFHGEAAYSYLAASYPTVTSRTLEYASGFQCVAAHGGGGDDEADLYGGAGDDTLIARPGLTTLNSTVGGVLVSAFSAYDFPRVYTFAGAGGIDTEALFGTTGADHFHGESNYNYLTSAGYLAYGVGFKAVTVYGNGGSDVADLFDSALDDLYLGNGWSGMLSSSAQSTEVLGFTRVNLFGTNGGSNRLHIGSLGYSLVTDDNWLPF